ncbi:hypothetical protein D6D02_05939 [Aureobasidium pullulans]|nr:hypothetical protein D6D03_04887 [Aureobasidium pullulans]THY11136.1 hypothetical protein D6D02_05939 [Aureobasidium pullulans]
MDQRRAPLAGPDHHYHRPSLPSDQSVPPSNQQIYPPPRPHSLPGVDAFHPHPPPPSHQYHGPHPPPTTVIHPAPHPEGPERAEHPYTAPPAVHGTPVIKTDIPPAPPQFPRPSSNPLQPQPQSQQHHPGPPPNTRPQMEHPQAAYAQPPPHPQAEHVNYVVAPMLDPYAQPPPGYYPQIQYMNPPLHMQNPNSRKKSMRASQACDRCRERKSKCDENRPCATCKDQNLDCNYKDTHPTKADKNNQALSDMVAEVLTSIKAMSDRLSVVEKHLSLQSSMSGRVDSPTDPAQSGADGSASDQNDVEVPIHMLQDIPEMNMEGGDHTTAAHKLLLRWPSVRPFIRTSRCSIQDNYVMKSEDRGLLRLYGVGERDGDDKVAIGAASPAPSINGEELIGTPPDNEPRRSEPFTPGSPAMAMDTDTVDFLFGSYKKHIHRLHPFVDIESLGKYLKDFQRRHCVDARFPPSPMFVSNGSGEREAKRRKRSDNYAVGLLPGDYSNSSAPSQNKRAPERTLTNAIVYLVLALGRICDASDPLAGPVQELVAIGKSGSHQLLAASPITRPSPSSPRQLFSNVANSSAGVTRAQSWDGAGSQTFDKKQAQNVDKIPGLNYYREACSILGDFSDSNELACAQACLLAGLYKGQLARVQESWSWINLAARTCLYRIKLDGLSGATREYPPRQLNKNENLTVLAYWTALQLESDILAEWDYPRSGLTMLESSVCFPTNVRFAEEPPTKSDPDDVAVELYYTAQMFLRSRLNEMHVSLYGAKISSTESWQLVPKLQMQSQTLGDWRHLNKHIAWSDDDPPASDILAARLRGKYYGALYVGTRLYLDYALHVMPEIDKGKTLEELTKDANGNQRETELALFAAINRHIDEDEIKEKCRICIESAMRSTVAFDGVASSHHRLIVTNIMGTAHAQFGNMLVLAAVYNCNISWLKELVPKDTLQSLLRRTIGFIRRLQHASNVAKTDVLILEAIDRTMFGRSEGSDIYTNEGCTGDSGESFNSTGSNS